jgi:hypothetical protein
MFVSAFLRYEMDEGSAGSVEVGSRLGFATIK